MPSSRSSNPPSPMYLSRPHLVGAEHLNFDPVPSKNVPIFTRQLRAVQNRDEVPRHRKCAPGDSQGVALARGSATLNSPLSRLLLELFLPKQEKRNGEFFFHKIFPQGLWNVEKQDVEKVEKNFTPQSLLKSYDPYTVCCG